jgi:hypothetical protein
MPEAALLALLHEGGFSPVVLDRTIARSKASGTHVAVIAAESARSARTRPE